jgi:hypothetical protein
MRSCQKFHGIPSFLMWGIIHFGPCLRQSVCLPLCLSVSLSMCFSVCLFFCPHVSLSVSLSVCLPLSVCLSVYLSLFLTFCLSVSVPVSLVVSKILNLLYTVFYFCKKLFFVFSSASVCRPLSLFVSLSDFLSVCLRACLLVLSKIFHFLHILFSQKAIFLYFCRPLRKSNKQKWFFTCIFVRKK